MTKLQKRLDGTLCNFSLHLLLVLSFFLLCRYSFRYFIFSYHAIIFCKKITC